ncbi:hypothetical protein GCM10009741_72050 [Kribbella lupini]|uniref:Uncharacterized protein n=1 Tax=Kribbella lupini TaxID=291602 RepID=A0ABN2CEZ9_9ACTN
MASTDAPPQVAGPGVTATRSRTTKVCGMELQEAATHPPEAFPWVRLYADPELLKALQAPQAT